MTAATPSPAPAGFSRIRAGGLWSIIAVLGGVAMWPLLRGEGASSAPLLPAPWWLPGPLVLLLLCLERAPIQVRIKPVTYELVATDPLLVLGLFLLDRRALIAAGAFAVALARATTIRATPMKGIYNIVGTAADIAVLVMVFESINASRATTGVIPAAAVLTGALASTLLGNAAMALVVRIHTGSFDVPEAARRAMVMSAIITLLSLTGLAAVTLYAVAPGNVALLGGAVLLVLVAFRSYGRSEANLVQVRGLYRFSSFLATAPSSSRGAAEVVAELRDLLAASEAHLFVDDELSDSLRVIRIGAAPALLPEKVLVVDLPKPVRRALRGGPSEWLDEGPSVPELSGGVATLVAPLRAGGRTLGVLSVAFVDGVVASNSLVEALANHIAIWLEHGRVLDKLRQAIAERERQAVSDTLTGLPNRRGFAEFAAAAIAATLAEERRGAVLLLDLDRFKQVNDTLGHGAGDQLIQLVARRLQRGLPPNWILARLGGDEFVVLVPETDGLPPEALAQRVRNTLRSSFEVEGIPLAVEASIGVALFPEDGRDVSTMLRRADMAMYAAKAEGSAVVRYSAHIDTASRTQLALLSDLRTALGDHSLTVHYQPKVDLSTGRVAGVEALVRWPRPGGMLGPAQFIPQAEQSALMGPLTSWVVRSAVRDYRSWRQAGLWLGVAVNLSARNLADAGLPLTLEELAGEAGLHPADITLELTESAVITNMRRAKAMLEGLRASGFRISLDDFGTGQASLQLLRQLPFTEVKIDRQFVQGMLLDDDDYSIVRAVIDLARSLGLDVVAEGVQDAETYQRLLAGLQPRAGLLREQTQARSRVATPPAGPRRALARPPPARRDRPARGILSWRRRAKPDPRARERPWPPNLRPRAVSPYA